MTVFVLFFPVSGYLETPKCCKTRKRENDKLTPFYPSQGRVWYGTSARPVPSHVLHRDVPSIDTKYVSFELLLGILRGPGEGRGGAPRTVPTHKSLHGRHVWECWSFLNSIRAHACTRARVRACVRACVRGCVCVCRGQKRTINFFNINCLAPSLKPPILGPQKKSLCASFPGKERQKGPT